MHNREEIKQRVHAVTDKFAERGLRSLAVAYQVTSLVHELYCKIITEQLGFALTCYTFFSTGSSRWKDGEPRRALAIYRPHASV